MPIPKLVITAAMMAAQMAMTMTRKIEGPRLDDTKFTGGDYGAPLPFVWGTRRLQVPIFWAENLTEVQRRRKTKGGKFNEYTYYGTFAVALAGHEIEGVRRIWFDTHLVYDLSGAGPVAPFDFGAAVGTITDYVTIYTGTETQDPDPRIQATEGEANTPAYRGTAYVVFKDVPLEKLGNRIPQVSVELSGAASFPLRTVSVGASSSSVALSRDGAFALLQNTSTASAELLDIAAGAVIGSYTLTGVDEAAALAADGVVIAADGSGNDIYSYEFGNPTPTLLYDKPVYFNSIETSVLLDEDGVEHWGASVGDSKYILDGVEYDIEDQTGVDAQTAGFLNGPDGSIWILAWEAGTPSARVFFVRVTGEFEVVTATGFSSTGVLPYACYYADLDHFVLQYATGFYTVDRATGTVTNTEAAPTYPTYSNRAPWYNFVPGSRSIWLGFYEVSLADLSVIRSYDPDQWGISGAPNLEVIYEPITNALMRWTDSTVRFFALDRVGVGSVALETICNDVAAACGVQDYDFSDLDQTLTGWSATRGQGSNMLEPLLDAYDSDIRPHEFGVEGLKRTGVASGAALETEWFTGQPRYSVTIKQSAELPRAMMVDFADVDADQQVNTARADRPLDATDARGEGKIDLSTLVLDASTALQLTNRYFRRMWNERTGISLSLTTKALALEPGDVRTLSLDGEEITARCTRMVARADDTIATEWKLDAATLATLDGSAGAEFLGREESVIAIPLLTRGFVLDIPYLRDADDSVAPIMYLAAAPYTAGTWPGATFYQAVSGEYTDEVGSVPSSSMATWGTVAESFAYANPNLWDRGTELTITLATGTLTGCTEAQADANPLLNLAAIGAPGRWELVQFTVATLDSGTTYTVSGFKRGRRGTEWAAELHAAGDAFVLLDVAQDEAFGLSEVGTTLSFKPVTAGRTVTGAFAQDVDFTGASLMPYAPAALTAVKESNGDWTITWVRRTRLGGAWTGGGTIPLGETTEAYELDIGDGVTTVTKTGITSPTYTWTVAAQTTDTGAEVMAGDLEVSAFQISATVDRGFAATITA